MSTPWYLPPTPSYRDAFQPSARQNPYWSNAGPMSGVQSIPPSIITTWICPINSAHRYTGGPNEFDAYIAHFDAQHTMTIVNASAPQDAPIQTDPTGYQFVEFNIQALFAKAIGRKPPFIHVKNILGQFGFHKELGGQNAWYASNFILLLGGAGEDKGVNPDDWYFYQGGPKQTSGIVTEDFDGGPIGIARTLISVRLQAYPLLENNAPNTQDKIDSVKIRVWGYV